MNPSNFIILYISKFHKGARKFILNHFEEANSLCHNNDDYLSYNLIEPILPKNCLVIDDDAISVSGSTKDYLLRQTKVRKFVEENKYVLYFNILNNIRSVKKRSFYNYWGLWDNRKFVLVSVFDKEYILRRLNKLMKLRVFS